MSRIASMLTPPSPADLFLDLKLWVQNNGLWWAASTTAHALVLVVVVMLLGNVAQPVKEGEAVTLESTVDTALAEQKIEHFEVGDAPLEPTELTTETLSLSEAPQIQQDEQINGSPNEAFEPAGGGIAVASTSNFGGLGQFDVRAIGPGPAVRGAGGVGAGVGTSRHPGSGGAGSGFAGRGAGQRNKMLGGYGGTKGSERAVQAALNWFARHQSRDGRWSMNNFQTMCNHGICTGPGSAGSDIAATSMALLPFLAAGQTHMTKGPYQNTILGGLGWLMSQQKPNGDLRGGAAMYSHGLATITLCEACGLSNDSRVRIAAQQAVNFIEGAQNPQTGGWHYSPFYEGHTVGDTSVVGWQLMGLKSGHMAGLKVNPLAFEGAKKWLSLVSSGKSGGLFSYSPGGGGSNTMTSVGQLGSQYLGAKRDDPAIQEGVAYFMANLPDISARDCYYWYYATQVMHNLPGPEWDIWNRKMRRTLIESQIKSGCAEGSWDPEKPTADRWGASGGRIMVTSLCCLTLEVYYRYLPLYRLDGSPKPSGEGLHGAASPEKKKK